MHFSLEGGVPAAGDMHAYVISHDWHQTNLAIQHLHPSFA